MGRRQEVGETDLIQYHPLMLLLILAFIQGASKKICKISVNIVECNIVTLYCSRITLCNAVLPHAVLVLHRYVLNTRKLTVNSKENRKARKVEEVKEREELIGKNLESKCE